MGIEELRYWKLEILKRSIQLVKTIYGLLNSFLKHDFLQFLISWPVRLLFCENGRIILRFSR